MLKALRFDWSTLFDETTLFLFNSGTVTVALLRFDWSKPFYKTALFLFYSDSATVTHDCISRDVANSTEVSNTFSFNITGSFSSIIATGIACVGDINTFAIICEHTTHFFRGGCYRWDWLNISCLLTAWVCSWYGSISIQIHPWTREH